MYNKLAAPGVGLPYSSDSNEKVKILTRPQLHIHAFSIGNYFYNLEIVFK